MTGKLKPVVLTIAGLDPSGGAGIVADIKTIATLGCFPAAALTSITFQNTTGVFGAEHQTAATLRAQVEPIVHDLEVAAAKTGMLPTAEIVAEVARLFAHENLPAPVVDPVVVATSGDVLIDDEAFEILKTKLFPLARVVTPNATTGKSRNSLATSRSFSSPCGSPNARFDSVSNTGPNTTKSAPPARAATASSHE